MNYRNTVLELCREIAPSGFEKPVTDRIRAILPDAEVLTDARGNLILHKKGTGKPVLVAANVDTSGFVVTFIGTDGFARFGTLGYHGRFASLIGMPVRFANGAKGVIGCDGGLGEKEIALKNLYIAVTAGKIALGDVCVPDLPAYADGDCVTAFGAESRGACAVLLDVLERAKDTAADLYAAFVVQSELGNRAAMNAAFRVEPQIACAIDAVAAGDLPKAEACSAVKLGNGAVLPILVGNGSANMELLEKLAEKFGKPVQKTVDQRPKSALFHLETVKEGAKAVSAAFPVRQYGSMATVNVKDMEQTAELILTLIQL